MPLTKSNVFSLFSGFRLSRMASKIFPTIVLDGWIFSLFLPGSPWIPTPNSISSSPISKVGLPAAGTVQLVKATPIVPAFLLTFSPSFLHSSNDPPSSAKDPTIFSTKTVAATPRLPVVNVESLTATSSLVTMLSFLPEYISAPIWKFIMSPE